MKKINNYVISKNTKDKIVEGVCFGLSLKFIIEEYNGYESNGTLYFKWLIQVIQDEVSASKHAMTEPSSVHAVDIDIVESHLRANYNTKTFFKEVNNILQMQVIQDAVSIESHHFKTTMKNGLIFPDKFHKNIFAVDEVNHFINTLKKQEKTSEMTGLSLIFSGGNEQKNISEHVVALSFKALGENQYWSFFDLNAGIVAFNNHDDFICFIHNFYKLIYKKQYAGFSGVGISDSDEEKNSFRSIKENSIVWL